MKKQLLFILLACGMYNAQVFSENFNGGSMPAGWTVNNPDTAFNWGVGTSNGFASFPSGAAFFDDDDAGPSGINTNARLVSPVINLSGVVNPRLAFKYANQIDNLNSTLKVEAFNGTSWVQVFSTSGASGTWTLDFNTFSYIVTGYSQASSINLTPYANAIFQLRFVYDDLGDYSYGVVVDDVAITSGVLAVSETSSVDKIKVYPNPVKDNLYIDSDQLKSDSSVTVLDMSGRKVKRFTGHQKSYDLSDLPKGNYVILIDNKKEIIRKKMIKD